MAPDRRRLSRRPLLPLALLAGLVAGLVLPVATAESATVYSQNLYRSGDFVRQTNLVQCVGASIQMMINLVEAQNDRTGATQLRLQTRARLHSDLIAPRPGGRKGASVWGWAATLNEEGYGQYVVAGFPTIDEALHAAASAIRFTGRPVGLLVWRGRHAWVMSGYRATADPHATQNFRVTSVNVMDPLYPASSSTWGRSPEPGARLTVAESGRDFVERRQRSGQNRLGGPFVIVMPVLGTAASPMRLKAA
jgi:hypothetical protein